MRLFNPALLFITLRYIKGSKKQRFASFVAVLATLGIAIGVCALIVVSSIMQGLQDRLKANILNDCAHVIVKATPDDIPYLLSLKHVVALVPYVQGEAMLQYGSQILMINLQANKEESLYVGNQYASNFGLTHLEHANFVSAHKDSKGNFLQFCIKMVEEDRTGYKYGPVFNFEPGHYKLALNQNMLYQLGINLAWAEKVRLISTQNARYTPFGLTPVQRNFTVMNSIHSLDNSQTPTVIGNYEDVRRFFRIADDVTYYRLYLSDPFLIDKVLPRIKGKYEFTDWRERYGEFFKAVGIEKVTMSTMLCLIILVAAFNILSSLTMLVSSRITELAILKTLGMSNQALLTIFLLVGMSASVVGSLLGVAVGIPLTYQAQNLLSFLGINIVSGKLPVQVDSMNILLIVVLCLLISMLCTFYPAYNASKTDPARSLRHK